MCAKVSKKELQTTFFKQLLLYNISFIKLLTITGRDKKMKTSKKRKRLPQRAGQPFSHYKHSKIKPHQYRYLRSCYLLMRRTIGKLSQVRLPSNFVYNLQHRQPNLV